MKYRPLLFVALGIAVGISIASVSERPTAVTAVAQVEPLNSHIVSPQEGGGAKYELRPVTVGVGQDVARVIGSTRSDDANIAQVYLNVDGTRVMTQFEVVEIGTN